MGNGRKRFESIIKTISMHIDLEVRCHIKLFTGKTDTGEIQCKSVTLRRHGYTTFCILLCPLSSHTHKHNTHTYVCLFRQQILYQACLME